MKNKQVHKASQWKQPLHWYENLTGKRKKIITADDCWPLPASGRASNIIFTYIHLIKKMITTAQWILFSFYCKCSSTGELMWGRSHCDASNFFQGRKLNCILRPQRCHHHSLKILPRSSGRTPVLFQKKIVLKRGFEAGLQIILLWCLTTCYWERNILGEKSSF